MSPDTLMNVIKKKNQTNKTQNLLVSDTIELINKYACMSEVWEISGHDQTSHRGG